MSIYLLFSRSHNLNSKPTTLLELSVPNQQPIQPAPQPHQQGQDLCVVPPLEAWRVGDDGELPGGGGGRAAQGELAIDAGQPCNAATRWSDDATAVEAAGGSR